MVPLWWGLVTSTSCTWQTTWPPTSNTSAIAKKARQWLHQHQRLSRAGLYLSHLTTFYSDTTESVPSCGFISWFGKNRKSQRHRLNGTMKTASKSSPLSPFCWRCSTSAAFTEPPVSSTPLSTLPTVCFPTCRRGADTIASVPNPTGCWAVFSRRRSGSSTDCVRGRCLTFEELVQSRHYNDADSQQLAEGEEDLNPCCPRHTHTVQVHDRSCRDRDKDRAMGHVCNLVLSGRHIECPCVNLGCGSLCSQTHKSFHLVTFIHIHIKAYLISCSHKTYTIVYPEDVSINSVLYQYCNIIIIWHWFIF